LSACSAARSLLVRNKREPLELSFVHVFRCNVRAGERSVDRQQERHNAAAARRGGIVDIRRGLLRALRNTGIIVIYQTPDLRVRWTQNIPLGWGDVAGKTDG